MALLLDFTPSEGNPMTPAMQQPPAPLAPGKNSAATWSMALGLSSAVCCGLTAIPAAILGPKNLNSVVVLDAKGKEVWRFAGKPVAGKPCSAMSGKFSPRGRTLAIYTICEPSMPEGLYVLDFP